MKPLREALHREDHWSRKLQSRTPWIMAMSLLSLAVGALVLTGIKQIQAQQPDLKKVFLR